MNVFCDGASNPFLKNSGIGIVWFDLDQFDDPLDGKTLKKDQLPKFTFGEKINIQSDLCKNGMYATNNEAEYMSLIKALEISIEKEMKFVNIFMDSKLVVKQVNGEWNINFTHLQKLKNKVDELRSFINFKLNHIRREYNTHADKASKSHIQTKSKQTKLNLSNFKIQ